jgi:NADH-quinone oxidoreductase subunit N
MNAFLALAPEAVIAIAALVVLFAELFGGDRAAAFIGALAALAASVLVFVVPYPVSLFGGALYFRPIGAVMAARFAIVAFTFLFLLWVFARGWAGSSAREAVSMTLFSAVGGMLLVTAHDLVTLFISLEIATMSAYVLIGYDRDERKSLEGTIKYFLLSVMTSLFLAYGLSFIYGLTRQTDYAAIDLAAGGPIVAFAALLVIVGLLAKVSAAPFQFWAPDAYEGAPVTSVAFVASIAKIGPVFALVRLVSEVLAPVQDVPVILLLAAVASMILGNLVALVQTDIRRLVAYSGIANMGYMLLGVSSHSAAGYAGALFFVAVYVVSVLGLLLVVAQEGATMQDVAGLVKRRPVAAWSAIGFLFSLIGFPPMVGFYGKLIVFGAALHAGHPWAVVIAIIMSVVSAGYAFNIIRAMFTPGESAPEAVDRPSLEEATTYRQMPVLAGGVILVLAMLTVFMGIFTQPIVDLFKAAMF